MSGPNKKLVAAMEAYFADLRYGPLAGLLDAVGATCKRKVFCVQEPADQGAGHPDFGIYTGRQVQKGRPREGQLPEQGVVEVKSADEDASVTAEGEQIERYRLRYGTVLVTNTRDFVLVGEDWAGQRAKRESFKLAATGHNPASHLESGKSSEGTFMRTTAALHASHAPNTSPACHRRSCPTRGAIDQSPPQLPPSDLLPRPGPGPNLSREP